MHTIRAMNMFGASTLASIVVFLTLSTLSHLKALEPVTVKVSGSFGDGRATTVTCQSTNPYTAVSQSHEGTTLVSVLRYYDSRTLLICYLSWQHGYVGVKSRLIAFQGAWGAVPYIDTVKNTQTRNIEFNWMMNENGLYRFDFRPQFHRYKRKKVASQVMGSAVFVQTVHIKVTNGFPDRRTVKLLCYSNRRTRLPTEFAKFHQSTLRFLGYGLWSIQEFMGQTIQTCYVGWKFGPNDADVAAYQFTVFTGKWRLDDSIRDPLTNEFKYLWFVNETGHVYLYNFTDRDYKFKGLMVHFI